LDTMLTPDLTGIQTARNRAAAARAAAGYQDFQAAALGVSVQIARAYVQAVTLERRLRLIDTSIAQGAELDRILRIRQREGAASMVELGLQSIRLKQLRAERSRIDEALDQSRTALAVLVGEEASRFDLALDGVVTFSKPTLGVPAPAELVRMRPDIRAAEARIRAEGGDVAAARRAFYPSVSLSAGAAVSAGALAPLAVAQQIGADILAPIFARNRLRGELELASAQQREAVSNYQAVLLNAFREVEDALSLVAHADEREKLLTDVEAEARLTETLARRQYLEGAADLQHLLDAQDLLISVQDALALGQQERIEGLIQIYAATAASA
jgi:outer membrane protein TolC